MSFNCNIMLVLIIDVLFLLVSESFSNDLPNYFPKCNLDDPKLNECIAQAANALRPYIRKGIAEIKFPSLDPLLIPTVTLRQESTLANYTTALWNFTIRGLDNYDLTEVRYNPSTHTFNGTIEFDSVYLASVYKAKGTLATIPVEGNGSAQATFGPINGTYEINGKIVKRNGIAYYKPTKTKIRMIAEDGSFNFNGLFDGNQELERVTNEQLNLNSKAVTDAVTPAFEKLLEVGLMYLMASLGQAAPYNKLFSSSGA